MGFLGRILERKPQLFYGGIDAPVKFNNGAVGPERAADFLSGHDLARLLKQHL